MTGVPAGVGVGATVGIDCVGAVVGVVPGVTVGVDVGVTVAVGVVGPGVACCCGGGCWSVLSLLLLLDGWKLGITVDMTGIGCRVAGSAVAVP